MPHERRVYGDQKVNDPAAYLHWGFILISLPNLIMICSMVAIFVVALLLPFPHHDSRGKLQ